MDRLAFTSLAAVSNQSEIRAQITNNLANVSTIGFKESYALASKTVDVDGAGFDSRSSVSIESQDIINLMPGVTNRTGRAMDVALNDATVLGVQADNGDLRIAPSGLIENAAGHLILGEGGPINVPPGQLVSISPDGTVFGSLPSEPATPPIELGKLLLLDASEQPLVRRVDGLFTPQDEQFKNTVFPQGPNVASLQSGALEGSNVNPIEAMIKMMDFSRSYEAQIKMISEIKSIDETGTTLMKLG
jgi:flagellar basal-body rod protein FlgF